MSDMTIQENCSFLLHSYKFMDKKLNLIFDKINTSAQCLFDMEHGSGRTWYYYTRNDVRNHYVAQRIVINPARNGNWCGASVRFVSPNIGVKWTLLVQSINSKRAQ